MVARSPPKLQDRKMAVPSPPRPHPHPPPPLDPTRIRETIEKVEKSIARLQELQFTVAGGKKKISGVTLSPRSTRGYLKTSLRCKQESLRIKNNARSLRSPPGKLPTNSGDWKRMSLPAMLLGETVGEILQASKFARQIVEAVDPNPNNPKRRTVIDNDNDDPKTPLLTMQSKNKQRSENNNLENCYSELRARRRREKQGALQVIRTESNNAPPSLQRAKSRIIFKVSSSSPDKKKKKKKNEECDKENYCKYIANRVSPRNKPWARKTVLFPNPLFHSSSSPTKQQQKFCKTKSPIIGRNSKQQSPHKFLIKSPSVSKFHVKIRSPPLSISSPTRSTTITMMSRKRSPKMISTAAAKLCQSFSPSRLANRLVSPLKSRKSVHEIDYGMKMMSGLKQRPTAMPPLRS